MTTSNTTAKPESPLLGRGRGEASYFSIQELTASATALREGIDNRPSKCAYHLLHVLVDQLLDPIREAWGEPIVISSGYRCKQLNALVGGVKNSHHILGCAADIIAGNRTDHRKLFKMIQKMQQEGRIKFTQLIWEGDGRWIHISYVPGNLKCQVIE
ncbi:MAG: peptidase M15 [Bacteroidaceae bacterium]|nr:peptidase M15 [Bacteroidaceae bacterium]